jgi:hypothetical protein
VNGLTSKLPFAGLLSYLASRSPRLRVFMPAIPVLFAAYEAYALIKRRHAAHLAGAAVY